MMRNLPPHELYAMKLSCLNFGYALFEPNPNGAYDFVRVGDVGYISEDGKFMRLFNAFNASDSLENVGSRFPDGFEPISEAYRERDQLEPLTPGCRRSQSVQMIRGGFSISGPVPQLIASGNFTLSCSSRAGAALITKCRGTRHKALASKGMENYMIYNCSSWTRLARDLGRPVEMHDLIFVRECTLSGDWANISWNSTTCDAEVDFSVGLPGVANIGLSFWGQWQQHVGVPKRQGPFRETPLPDGEVPVLNQCIFLKGIRISERSWYNKMTYLLRSSSGSKTMKNVPFEQPALKLLTDKDFKITAVGDVKSSFRPIQNAYDALACYIFESSDADFALIDDDDIFSLSMYKASKLEEICEILLNLGSNGPTIEISLESNEAKVGRISWKAPQLGLRKSDDLILLDENLNALLIADRGLPQILLPATHEPQHASPGKEIEGSNLEPLDIYPPPPLPWESTNAYMTRLMNLQAKCKMTSLDLTRQYEGEGHQPLWTTICTIDGKEYGRSTNARRKGADEEAARQALLKICNENDWPAAEAPPSFLPGFNSYLAKHGLTNRLEMVYEKSGEDHSPTWTCRVLRDKKFLAKGVGRKKKEAEEQAARNAAAAWSDL